VLGGYTSTALNDYNNYYDDADSFIFNLPSGKSEFNKYECNVATTAVYHTDLGFIQFGEGPDLFIGSDAKVGMSCSSYFTTFGPSDGTSLNVGDASEIFNVDEIEVYQLTLLEDKWKMQEKAWETFME